MIIVTGGAGFIGSNLVHALCQRGESVVVVDDLTDGHKFQNLVDCPIQDYFDKDTFIEKIRSGAFEHQSIRAIFHQGACSATTEWNGRFMMENNFEYSKTLLHFCLQHRIPFLYASSAAVYGMSGQFREQSAFESPLNVYGYSKLLFDQYVRQRVSDEASQVVGLRYFNVYGPREQHKGTMSSVAYHFNQQLTQGDTVRLFEGTDGYDHGEQRRDFIHVEDVVSVNLWLLDHPAVQGVFNVGTGRSEPFNAVANAVIDWHGRGRVEYVPFPEHLKNCYQSYTQADISALRAAGYTKPFLTVSEGVKRYLDLLNAAEVSEVVSA